VIFFLNKYIFPNEILTKKGKIENSSEFPLIYGK